MESDAAPQPQALPDISALNAEVMQLRTRVESLATTVDMWGVATDSVGDTAVSNLNAISALQALVSEIATKYDTVIDMLQVRAATAAFASPIPTTVEQQLKDMRATIKKLQAEIDMTQNSTQETSTSETTERALRFD